MGKGWKIFPKSIPIARKGYDHGRTEPSQKRREQNKTKNDVTKNKNKTEQNKKRRNKRRSGRNKTKNDVCVTQLSGNWSHS